MKNVKFRLVPEKDSIILEGVDIDTDTVAAIGIEKAHVPEDAQEDPFHEWWHWQRMKVQDYLERQREKTDD